MAGFIKLYRDLQENPIWNDKPFSKGQAWIDIIFRCNHVCKKVMGYGNVNWVLRGQFISSNYKLAEAWGWSESNVRKFIRLLQDNQMMLRKPSVKWTLYEVIKYCVYQSVDTSESQEYPNAQKTHKKRTTNAQKTPNKNDNNDKELKELINTYTQDPDLIISLEKFIDMRINKKKPPTNEAMRLILKKLKPFSTLIQIKMLEKSIVNNWTDVFPLKESNQDWRHSDD